MVGGLVVGVVAAEVDLGQFDVEDVGVAQDVQGAGWGVVSTPVLGLDVAEDVGGGVGTMGMGVGQGAGDGVAPVDGNEGVDLPQVTAVVGVFVFEAEEVGFGGAAESQEVGDLAVLASAFGEVAQGVFVGGIDDLGLASVATEVTGDEGAVGGVDVDVVDAAVEDEALACVLGRDAVAVVADGYATAAVGNDAGDGAAGMGAAGRGVNAACSLS